MNEFFKKIQSIGVIPVVKINDSKNAVGLAKALCKGGLPMAEITFRSAASEDAIREITKNVPEISVCAGTVLTVETAECAVKAGAKGIISPGTNPEVVKWCQEHDIPVIPGCATPSDVERCMGFGLSVVKLFPAEVVGGVKMLKALSGPYANIMFMPTGGISVHNLKDYLSLKNVLACGGSWMVPENLIDAGEYEQIAQMAKEAAELFHTIR